MRRVEIAASPRQDLVSKVCRRLAVYDRARATTIRRPEAIISFTFDDIPDSALANGARLLEDWGARGTFYIAGGLCGAAWGPWEFADEAGIAALHRRGHEIGCHTFNHPDIQTLTRREVAQELDANAAFLNARLPDLKLANFAYPYGMLAIPQKRLVQKRFRSARGIRQGINAGTVDLGQLMACRLYDALLTPDDIDRLVEEAVARRGWLIFYTHDVAENPTDQGCSPALMAAALAGARRLGADILTIDAALDRLFQGAA